VNPIAEPSKPENRDDRLHPTNAARKVQHRIGPAEFSSIHRKKLHLFPPVFSRQTEQLPDPILLQGNKIHIVSTQKTARDPYGSATNLAVSVIKHPRLIVSRFHFFFSVFSES